MEIKNPEHFKTAGNKAWEEGNVQEALSCYSQAIYASEKEPKHNYFGNRANCYLSLR
jgi:histone-lysine N-methyltransferase SETD3